MNDDPIGAEARPFEGIRMIDLTRGLAGPFCSHSLAGLGAGTTKGEQAGAPAQGWADDEDARASRLATHFVELSKANPVHAQKAARYTLVAGQRAAEQTAWDEAAEHYERCLSAIEGAEDGLGEDPRR